MSWYGITVKPKGGPPAQIYINEWIKLDYVSDAEIMKDGSREYRVMVGRELVYLLQKDGRWYLEGQGPKDKFYP